MPIPWQTVHVFISSTFNDMHAERDYLVKQVFPRLAEWCERRRLRLVDIDLRWGVTEADATQNQRAVQVCLERIDACRPFFLCFLGQRRGWMPAADEIAPETLERYPELARYAGTTSVTEMEILHALIDPLHRGRVVDPDGKATEYAPAEHAFFYLREPAYLDHPEFPPQLRPVYTNEGITNPDQRAAADDQLRNWRDSEIPKSGRPCQPYAARWDAGARTPEILLPLRCPSSAAPGSGTWQVSFKGWAKEWARAGVRVGPTGEIGEPVELAKAQAHNARLTQGRLVDFNCAGAALAETILADLQRAIAARYPKHIETPVVTPLQRELDQQAQFLQAASEGFIERAGDFVRLDDYAHGPDDRLFVLTAAAGVGKTSLLAHWIDKQQLDAAAGRTLQYRFIGGSEGSTTVDGLLRSIVQEIREVTGKLAEEIPADPAKLRAAWPALLGAAASKGKLVIVLDGLNQLETGLTDPAWLPVALPPNVRLVVSFKRGDPAAESYHTQLQTGRQAILAEVQPFAGLEERRKLVRAYLSHFLKELDESHLEALIRSDGASNPLYLKVVLAELRVFGAFADLGAKIQEDFGATPVSAFGALLRRLENDAAYSPIQPEVLVPRVFGWLAHARQGLSAQELSGLLVQDEACPAGPEGDRQAEAAVHGLLRQVRPYLARREGRADFFFESFKQAVIERYVQPTEEADVRGERRSGPAWHATLAAYFGAQSYLQDDAVRRLPNLRKLVELPYQQTKAGLWDALYRTLTDPPFLDLKSSEVGRIDGATRHARHEGVYDLLEDLRRALDAIPGIAGLDGGAR